jgi:hypothetical protein
MSERIFERFEHPRLQVEVSQIIIHKTHQPNVVVHFFDTDRLAGKDLAEIDLLLAQTDAPATGDHDGFIVEGLVDVRQAGVGTRGRLVDLRGTLVITADVGGQAALFKKPLKHCESVVFFGGRVGFTGE